MVATKAVSRAVQLETILCIILMCSGNSVAGNDNSADEGFESTDTAAGRRLLGTSYTMPKLNFLTSDEIVATTCETFGIGLGFKLLNLPCSGQYPFSIKRCSTTADPTFLESEVRRLQQIIQYTNQTACGEKFANMCKRVTSKLQTFQPLIIVDSESSNETLSTADGAYVLKDVLKMCCNPLSECAVDEDCSSQTPYNVQECCSNCELTYQMCYYNLNADSEIDMKIPSIKKLIHGSIARLCASEDCKPSPPCWGFGSGS